MTRRILLVEDDRHIALALKIRLQAEGFDVAAVRGVAEAVQVACKNVPDIALIDYNLPDGNGFELMRSFAAAARTRSIRSIFMTASKQPGLRDRALDEGAVEYFEKPFKSLQLIQLIHSMPVH